MNFPSGRDLVLPVAKTPDIQRQTPKLVVQQPDHYPVPARGWGICRRGPRRSREGLVVLASSVISHGCNLSLAVRSFHECRLMALLGQLARRDEYPLWETKPTAESVEHRHGEVFPESN